MYLLIGPTLLFLASSLLVPDFSEDTVDLHAGYWHIRKHYYVIQAVFWAWVLLVWPVFGYPVAPTWKFIGIWLVITITLRMTENVLIHKILVSASLVLLFVFIGVYAMQLGSVAGRMIH